VCEIRIVGNIIVVGYIKYHEKGMKHEKKKPENRIKI
jgi:hypothetical protein